MAIAKVVISSLFKVGIGETDHLWKFINVIKNKIVLEWNVKKDILATCARGAKRGGREVI